MPFVLQKCHSIPNSVNECVPVYITPPRISRGRSTMGKELNNLCTNNSSGGKIRGQKKKDVSIDFNYFSDSNITNKNIPINFDDALENVKHSCNEIEDIQEKSIELNTIPNSLVKDRYSIFHLNDLKLFMETNFVCKYCKKQAHREYHKSLLSFQEKEKENLCKFLLDLNFNTGFKDKIVQHIKNLTPVSFH